MVLVFPGGDGGIEDVTIGTFVTERGVVTEGGVVELEGEGIGFFATSVIVSTRHCWIRCIASRAL